MHHQINEHRLLLRFLILRLQVLRVRGSCYLRVRAGQAVQHTLGNCGVSLWSEHRLVAPACDVWVDGV